MPNTKSRPLSADEWTSLIEAYRSGPHRLDS